MPPRKSWLLQDLISSGLVADGELLRYKNKQGQLLMVGLARQAGVEVADGPKPLGLTAFEGRAGSKYHRPAEYTHTTAGRSLQELQQAAGGGCAGRPAAAAAPLHPPLMEDDSDEFCHACGLGGDLLCCETCPATFHTGCVGLAALPEGDWHCAWCRCPECGAAGFGPLEPPPAGPAVTWLATEHYASPAALRSARGPPLVHAARPAAAGGAAGAAAGAEAMAVDTGAAPAGPAKLEADAAPVQGSAAELPGSSAAAAPAADLSALAAAAAAAVVAAGGAAAGLGGGAAGPWPPEARRGNEELRCPGSGRRWHARCAAPAGTPGQAWFGSPSAARASFALAGICAAGALPLGALPDGTRLSFQLVHGAAAAAPDSAVGYAPAYSEVQRGELRALLSAALHVLHSSYTPLLDSRTGADALCWLLRGAALAGGAADLRGAATALLLANGVVVAAGVLRVLGPALAELPVLAVRPELRGCGLGRLALAAAEAAATACGARLLMTPAFAAPGRPCLAPTPPEPAALGPAAAEPAGVAQAAAAPAQPILQERWGYAPATPEQVAAFVAHPTLRTPGVLLAAKRLEPAAAPPAVPLPGALVWNAAVDARACVREGLAVAAALPAAPTPGPAEPAPIAAAPAPPAAAASQPPRQQPPPPQPPQQPAPTANGLLAGGAAGAAEDRPSLASLVLGSLTGGGGGLPPGAGQ